MAELALENKFQHKTNKSSSSLGLDRDGLISYEPPWVMPDLVQLVPEHLLGWEGRNRQALSFGCDGSWSSLLMLIGKVSPTPGFLHPLPSLREGQSPQLWLNPQLLLQHCWITGTSGRCWLSLSGFQLWPFHSSPCQCKKR